MSNQHTALGQGLEAQRQRGSYVDFTIIAHGGEFPCHRVVLAAMSPFFDTMFNNDMQVFLSTKNNFL